MLTRLRTTLDSLSLVWKIAGTIALIALLGISGSCFVRSWRAHREPKPAPPVVDPGIPKAETAPPVISVVSVTRPNLSEAELRAEAARFGYVLAKPIPVRNAGRTSDKPQDAAGKATAPTAGTVASGQIAASGEILAPWNGIPVKLAEERFRHEASEAEIDVAAFYVGEGNPVDLRGSWRPWTPPKPPENTCDSGGLVGTGEGGKWRLGPGAIASSKGVGVGPVGGFNYDGFRILGASATADIAGGWSEASGPVGMGMLGLSW